MFLVEGPSDAAALERVMQQLHDPAKIRFHALRADITAMRQPAGKSIKTAVNDVVCRRRMPSCLRLVGLVSTPLDTRSALHKLIGALTTM